MFLIYIVVEEGRRYILCWVRFEVFVFRKVVRYRELVLFDFIYVIFGEVYLFYSVVGRFFVVCFGLGSVRC